MEQKMKNHYFVNRKTNFVIIFFSNERAYFYFSHFHFYTNIDISLKKQNMKLIQSIRILSLQFVFEHNIWTAADIEIFYQLCLYMHVYFTRTYFQRIRPLPLQASTTRISFQTISFDIHFLIIIFSALQSKIMHN